MSILRLLTKEEYDKLIKEIDECKHIFINRFTEYKEMIKINPRVYNDASEDLQIYYEILSEIKLDELLEKQYQTTINIRNQFENAYVELQMEVDEILYINKKYNNINCAERKRQIIEFYDTLLYGSNLNHLYRPSASLVPSMVLSVK